MITRKDFLKLIEKNINKNGYHITFVKGGQNPYFTYTIGLKNLMGFELVIAGGHISIKLNEITFERILSGLNSGLNTDSVFPAKDKNEFDLVLSEMHSTWKKQMILGVYDYFDIDDAKAFQILPRKNRFADTPDMSVQWDKDDPIWCWLDKEWTEPIPIYSYVVTNVDFLKGGTITEMTRWEDGYWEMFVGAGEDSPDEDVRILPFSTMLAIDESLRPAMKLKNGDGLRRKNKNSKWRIWE